MENVKDIGFFKKVKRAIFNFDEYGNFATEKMSKTIKYFLKVILIFSLILTTILMIKVYKEGFMNIVESSLQMENLTEEQTQALNELIQTIENSEKNETVYIISFAISMFIVTFITFVAIVFFDAFTLSILGLIINLLIGTKFKYGEILKISIYSMTLPVVLFVIYGIVYTLYGFTIKYFEYAYDAISYIYLVTAMLMLKSEMIKNMQEVEKVVKVQKQVEEETNEKPEKKSEEKKEKNKGKKKKENEDSGEPQGNNA